MVHLGDVFQDAPKGWSPLTVWLGKDIAGKAIGTDLAKQPHILSPARPAPASRAASTRCCRRSCCAPTPNEVRLVLVDPKQVELNHYEASRTCSRRSSPRRGWPPTCSPT